MNDQEKWEFLRNAPAADRWHPKIWRLAKDLNDAADHDSRRFVMLAHAVARDWIKQEPDGERVGGEDIAGLTRHPLPDDAVDALDRGIDDCDAKARVFVALCLAAGLAARMVPFWRNGRLYHVAAEVSLGGHWLPVETTLSRARLGELGANVPKEPNGRWLES